MNKLVIFGVGLIGGSLALALKKAGAVKHVIGVGRNQEHLAEALALGVIDEAAKDVATAVNGADMIVIAAPVAQTPSILSAILPHLSRHTTITDVGSTKSDIVTYVHQILKEKSVQFVPAHPIAGAEKSGVSAAKSDLFVQKNVVITPCQETESERVLAVRAMWLACEANVTAMTAAEHDQIFAAVSHLPHLLAFTLVNELANRNNAEQLFGFAASGFRDFTRIAGSHPEMWRDISLANRDALLLEIDQYQQRLSQLKTLLQQADSAAIQQFFEQASTARNNWEQKKKP